MTTGLAIFARLDSRRLPGKALMPIAGRPLLGHVIDRARRARRVDRVIVATTDRPVDDPIAAFADGEGVSVFRGDAADVLGRAVACARAFRLATLVRISGDSPFIDPGLIDHMLEVHAADRPDATTNM